MKLFRDRRIQAALLLLVSAPFFVSRAALSDWARNVVVGTPLEAALFKTMDAPGGPVLGRRMPAESRVQLTSLIEKDPRTGRLYSLRALEDERQLEITAAEADWRTSAELASDPVAGREDLAAFYQRRVEHQKQIAALLDAANQPVSPNEALLTDSSQTRSWKDFARAVQVAQQANLPNSTLQQIYEAWLTRWPNSQSGIFLEYFRMLVARGDKTAASTVLARFKTKFPDDWADLLQANEELQDTAAAKLAVYSDQFSAVWPPNLLQRYFQLLGDNHQLRSFIAAARSQHESQPTALDPVLKLSFYYEQSGKQQIADQTLRDFVSSAPNRLTAAELKTVGQIFSRLHDYEAETQAWYTLYGLQSASAADKRDALVSLANVLLDASEQPMQFGSRDLSLYKNIATMDRTPGFLNGILSVALNSSGPDVEYSTATQTSVAYFHRAAASQLAERLTREFPAAIREQEQLAARLFTVYGIYGQDDALLAQLPAFLSQHKQAPGYIDLALLLGDVYSRNHREADELALYDSLLTELAAKANRVPLGDQPQTPEPDKPASPQTVRSLDYSRILDRYIARLVQAKRLRDAVALFRREIHDNPADPGLYARLAAFVEQNRFDADLEQTYREATQQFPGATWSEKLGRLYLRQHRSNDYQKLTQQLTDIFTGDEIETYLQHVSPSSSLNPSLYLQVNLYAHRRFPRNLTFVRNLLTAYRNPATADAAAADKILRENWFCEADLRDQYFRELSRNGRLPSMLAAAAKTQNTVALAFKAEGDAWLTHYESAAPAYAQLAQLIPGDLEANQRALSLHRSLSAKRPAAFLQAVNIGEKNLQYAPGSFPDLSTQGELYAEREQFSKAAPYWDRLAQIDPGNQQGYLEAATIYWDYFQFNDALRLVADGRHQLKSPALFAYEAGAIYENKLNLSSAVDEYIRGAITTGGSQADECQNRLIRLARREAARSLIEQKTTAALENDPNLHAFHLRLALLESQDRRNDQQQLLDREIGRLPTPESILEIRREAARLGFNITEEHAIQRLIALTSDPVEKIQFRLELAAFHEGRNDSSAAEAEFNSLLRENPTILGVVRANVEFYQRGKQSAKAAAVLEAAANRAEPTYKRKLLREAAEREVEARRYEAARKLLDALLAADPYSADLLAAKAETWSKQGDTSALAAFYASELQTMQNASLPASEKTDRIAGLRRGYVLALDRLNRFSEATDQYIEIINRYPEDDQLLSQAAQLADAHQLGDRLISYYAKAVADSPKDYRWPMVLARLDVLLGKYPEAITAYEKAAYVRPDRTDFLIAKADLETRLLRFDDALATNQRLYTLTFHNPAYLDAQATLLARLGRKEDAIKMLRAALINGRPANWSNYQSTAQRLAGWNLYPEAQQVIEEGLAPTKLNPNQLDGYDLYLRILTIQRKHDQAIKLVSEAVAKAAKQEQVFESAAWMSAIGETMNRYYTPEEKAAAAAVFAAPGHVPANVNFRQFLRVSGFAELYADYLNRQAKRRPAQWTALDQYQHSRLRLLELAHQLEALPPSQTPGLTNVIQSAATQAYVDSGSKADVIRLVQKGEAPGLNPETYAWMIEADPGRYASRIPTSSFGKQIIENLIRITDESRSFAAIQTGDTHNPLWVPTATALTGLYYLSSQPRVVQSFDQLLGPRTVQTELASLSSPATDHLRGDSWFYQAARFGDYLAYKQQPTATEYLPAAVEFEPAASDRYVEFGDTLRDANQAAKAHREYEYAAELSPQRADILDRLAVLDWAAGDHSKAIGEWKQAFSTLRNVTPSFGPTAQALLTHVNRYGVLDQVKPEADAMLHLYIKHNGAFQFEPIVEGALSQTKNRAAAIQWMIALSHDENGAEILQTLANSPQLRNAERDPVYREMIQLARKSANDSNGDAAREAKAQVNSRRLAYVTYLENERHYDRALQELEIVQPDSEQPVDIQIRLEALNGRLNRDTLAKRASKQTLLQVAQQLEDSGHSAQANILLDVAYTSAIAGGNAAVTDYFGLAQLRLQQKRTDEALKLLRTAVIGHSAPFENTAHAARLLEHAGLAGPSKEYYDQWRKAEPWNFDAQLTSATDAVRKSNSAPYATRVIAARAMRVAKRPASGANELDVLTLAAISPASASQPFFVAARVDAAAQTPDPAIQTKLYTEAIAIDPTLQDERRQLARAASLAKQDYQAIAAYNSTTRQGSDVIPRYPPYGVPQPAHQSAEDIELRELIAASYVRLHRLNEADALLAPILQDDPRAKAMHEKLIVQIRLAELNAQRSPIITVINGPNRIVKPQLRQLPSEDEEVSHE